MPKNKPVDRWLTLFAFVGAIIMWLISPQNRFFITLALISIFFLLLHPIWNFWWIEESSRRRVASILTLLVLLVVLGYYVWPPVSQINQLKQHLAEKQPTDEEKIAKAEKKIPTQEGSTFQEKSSPPKPTFKEPLIAKLPPIQPQPKIRKESPTDVALRFIYPKEPALMIKNLSDSVARDIKWSVLLWNMDLPDRNDPLPIPIQTFDWIKGHDEGGPQSIFNSPSVSPLLKDGNRLFGSALVRAGREKLDSGISDKAALK